jgi:hypothetical protein
MFLKEAELSLPRPDLEQQVLGQRAQDRHVAVGFGYPAEVGSCCLRRYSAGHPAIGVRVRSMSRCSRTRSRTVDLVVAEASMLEDDALEVLSRLAMSHSSFAHPPFHAPTSRWPTLDYPFNQIARMPPRGWTPLLQRRRRSVVQL